MKRRKKVLSKKRPIIFNSSSNLPFDNLSLQNDVTRCEPSFLVRQCGCGRVTIATSCMRKNCLNCTKRLNSRRALAAFNRFSVYKEKRRCVRKGFAFCYTDFTIPPGLRQNYTMPKKWQKFRVALWQLLRDKYGALFAVEGTHPIGDEHPDVFHPHLNFLWIPRDGYPSYIPVADLRDDLRGILNYSGPVDCYHQYGATDAELMHWSKYVTRIFPEFSAWAGHTRWYGSYPKYKPVNDCFCSVCEKQFRVIGSIHRSLVNDFEERGFWLGRAPPWDNDKNIMFFKSLNID